VKGELKFESVMAVTTKFAALWVVTPLRLVNIRQFSKDPALTIWVDI